MLVQGKAKWFKVLGEPHWGYENKHKEWSFDLYLDEDTVKKFKSEGLGKRLKDKGNGTYITFKRKELKFDGTPNQPIRVVDHKGQSWDDRKVGNDSTLNVNFAINEYGKGEKSPSVLSVQVWELIPYNSGDFPIREDDETTEDDWSKEVA